VDAYARLELHTELLREGAKRAMIRYGIVHGLDRTLEQHEKAVGLVDLHAAVLPEKIARESVPTPEDVRCPGVAQTLDEGGAAHEVAHEEGLESELS